MTVPTARTPRAPAFLALAALAALLAPAAFAQTAEAPAALTLRLDPASAEARPGGGAATLLLFSNPHERPLTLALRAEAADLKVALEPAEVVVPAHGTARAKATLHVPQDAAPGERTVVFRAGEVGSSAPVEAKAELALRVLAPPWLRVSPDPLDAAVPPGGSRTFLFKVENPGVEARRAKVHVETPVGWKAVADVAEIDLPPRAFRGVNVTLAAEDGAGPAGGALLLTDGTRSVKVPIHLRPVVPPATAADVASPLAPEPAKGVTMRVEPPLVELPVGGRAVPSLVVVNGGRTAITPAFDLTLPAGVHGSFAAPPESIPPGAEVALALVLEAAPTMKEGESHRASVQPRGQALPRAAFVVRMLPPQEPAPTTSAASSEDATVGYGVVGLVALGAAGVGGAAAGVAWLHRKWPLAFAALYTRLLPSSVLAHPVRERLAQTVRERPGVTFSDLKRALGMGSGTLTHHARVLEEAGVLFSTQDGQTRRFYAVGHGRVAPTPPLDERALAALRTRGPMSAADLARELGVSRQALHYHLKRMAREGRIASETRGREVVVRIAATAPA